MVCEIRLPNFFGVGREKLVANFGKIESLHANFGLPNLLGTKKNGRKSKIGLLIYWVVQKYVKSVRLFPTPSEV